MSSMAYIDVSIKCIGQKCGHLAWDRVWVRAHKKLNVRISAFCTKIRTELGLNKA